jgi:hypothetical protein
MSEISKIYLLRVPSHLERKGSLKGIQQLKVAVN